MSEVQKLGDAENKYETLSDWRIEALPALLGFNPCLEKVPFKAVFYRFTYTKCILFWTDVHPNS